MASRPPTRTNTVAAIQKEFANALRVEDLGQAIEVLRDAMGAVKTQAVGRYTYETTEDHPVRLSAARTLLEYAIGKPVSVSEISVTPQAPGGFAAGHEDVVPERLRVSGLDLRRIAAAYSDAEEAEVLEPAGDPPCE